MSLGLMSQAESAHIHRRLRVDLTGVGILVIGFAFGVIRPENDRIGLLIQAIAALYVGAAVLLRGIPGLVNPTPRNIVDQLVALTVLATGVSGDFLTATLLPLVLDLGRLFEERSAMGSARAIQEIHGLQAREATRITKAGREESVPAKSLVPGDIVIIRPGEVIPADGRVQTGESTVDQSPITGESLPEVVEPEGKVFAGAKNLTGLLRVEVTAVGAGTALGKVVALLREAETLKVTPFMERMMGVYFPMVLSGAATVLFFTHSMDTTIGVLIAALPTALLLAGPAAMVAAFSAAARLRAIIKSPTCFEKLREIDLVVFDKTGTLTEGSQEVVERAPLPGVSGEQLLRIAAIAGQGSLHPISKALVRSAQKENLTLPWPESAHEIPGRGVTARVDGTELLMGRRGFLQERGIDLSGTTRRTEMGVWVAEAGVLLGFIRLVDPIRTSAAPTFRALRDQGREYLAILTGDRTQEAQRVAEQLQVTEWSAEVLPEEKAERVSEWQAKGHTVLMIGDGVNDALALQRANVGIAMGARLNEAALGGADIALMDEALENIPALLALSERVAQCQQQNVLIGLSWSGLLFGLVIMGYISPLPAALLHNVGALWVVWNSARMLRIGTPH